MLLIEKYFNQQIIDFLASIFGLFPAGILLAVLGWLISITIYAAFKFVKS